MMSRGHGRNIQTLYAKYIKKVYRGGGDEIPQLTLFGYLFDKTLTYTFGTGKYQNLYKLYRIDELDDSDKEDFEEIKKDFEEIKKIKANFVEIAPYLLYFFNVKTQNVTSMLFGKTNQSTVQFISIDDENLAEYDYLLAGRQPS